MLLGRQLPACYGGTMCVHAVLLRQHHFRCNVALGNDGLMRLCVIELSGDLACKPTGSGPLLPPTLHTPMFAQSDPLDTLLLMIVGTSSSTCITKWVPKLPAT